MRGKPVWIAGLAGIAIAAALWQLTDSGQPAVPTPRGEALPEPAHAPGPATAPAVATPERSAPPAEERTPLATANANADAAQGVRGRLVDERGVPVAAVEVFLVESASNDPIHRFVNLSNNMPLLATASTRTGADGTFRLGVRQADDRSLELGAAAPGHADLRVGDLRLHAGEWLDLGDVAFRLGTLVRGRVTVAGTSLPAPGATVRLESGDPFFDAGPAQLGDWQQRHVATVDQDGGYELRDAPRSGLFRLLATAPGFGREIKDGVQFTDGTTVTVDFALPRGLSIEGMLVADGRPLGTVRIEAYSHSAEPAFVGSVATDGRFFVHGLREGPHLLKIAAEGFQPRNIDDVAAGTRDLTVLLEPRARATLSVYDPDGRIVRRYRLAVRRWLADSHQLGLVHDVPERMVDLAADARATEVEGLDDGTYVFQVDAEGAANSLSEPFTLDAVHRLANVSLRLARGGRLTGRCVDAEGKPVAGAEVTTQPSGQSDENPLLRALGSLTPDRITRATATTDAAGRFTLAGLAWGDYQLQIEHREFCRSCRRDLKIEGDTAQELPPVVLQRGTAVRGRALLDGVATAQVLVVLGKEPTAAGPEPGPGEKTWDETAIRRVEAVTNSDGSFELPRRIPPGTYELRGAVQLGSGPVADPFQRFLQLQKSAIRVTVLPGQEVAEFELLLASAH